MLREQTGSMIAEGGEGDMLQAWQSSCSPAQPYSALLPLEHVSVRREHGLHVCTRPVLGPDAMCWPMLAAA